MGIRTAGQIGSRRLAVEKIRCKILIVGGGIAGLSLAKALEQRGMAADLVERQSGEPANGAGLYLLGNASRALQQLGLLAEVTAKAVAIETQRIFDWRGKLLSTVRTHDVWCECGPCLALPRNALQTMLQAALVRTDVSLGKAVAYIRQSPAGCEVAFNDGRRAHTIWSSGPTASIRRCAGSPLREPRRGARHLRGATPAAGGMGPGPMRIARQNAPATGVGEKRNPETPRPDALPAQLYATAQADLTGGLQARYLGADQ
jgi:hypothetical protein